MTHFDLHLPEEAAARLADEAVYDACVLYLSPLRGLLMRLAVEDLVLARWSEEILDEASRPALLAVLRARAADLRNPPRTVRDMLAAPRRGLSSLVTHVLASFGP